MFSNIVLHSPVNESRLLDVGSPLVLWHGSGALHYDISEDPPSIRIHMAGAFAKTKKATDILRPAIDVSFLSSYEDFLSIWLLFEVTPV